MQGRIKHKDLDVFRDLASLSSIRVRNGDAHDSDQLPGCTAKAGPCWASKSSESCSTADFNKRPACWSPGDTWPCSRRKERPDVVQMFYGWYDCLVDCLQTQGNLVTSPQHRENWWNLWKSVVSKLRKWVNEETLKIETTALQDRKMHTVRRSATPWKLQKCDKCIEPAGRPAWIVGEIWTPLEAWIHGLVWGNI